VSGHDGNQSVGHYETSDAFPSDSGDDCDFGSTKRTPTPRMTAAAVTMKITRVIAKITVAVVTMINRAMLAFRVRLWINEATPTPSNVACSLYNHHR
jgi:hypothetical protein